MDDEELEEIRRRKMAQLQGQIGDAQRQQEAREEVESQKQAILRKAIGKGVKPIPDYKKVLTNRYIEKNGMAIYPIGIKKDPRGELLGYEQELL